MRNQLVVSGCIPAPTIPHGNKRGRFLVNVALFGVTKVFGRQVDVTFVGNEIKWAHGRGRCNEIILLMYKLWQEQEPSSITKGWRCHVPYQFFNVIVAVGRIGNQNIKRRARVARPNGVAVLFAIVDVAKAKFTQISSHCTVTVIGIIKQCIFTDSTTRISQQGSNVLIRFDWRLTVVIGVRRKRKVWAGFLCII